MWYVGYPGFQLAWHIGSYIQAALAHYDKLLLIRLALGTYVNIGALPRRGVAPKSQASVRIVRFIPEAPYLGGLTGTVPYLGCSACQAQGSQELWKFRIRNAGV